jgi:hypothetical protein
MILNKLKMTHASFILAVFCICVVKMGFCFSDPPSNQKGTITSIHDGNVDLNPEKMNKDFNNYGEIDLQEQSSNPYPLPSDTNDPSPSEKVTAPSDIPSKDRLIKMLKKNTNKSLNPSYDTFRDLRKDNGFIDKTEFILKFHKELFPVTAILRPRRTGKSMGLNMLKEFYCKPKIDIASYDPETRKHNNSNFTAKSTFENTFVLNSTARKEAFEGEDWKKESDLFIIDHMNKWPVIFVDMFPIDFGSKIPSHNKIEEKLSTEVIQKTFEEHEDVLFALMTEKACSLIYKRINRENYLKMLKYLDIDDNEDLSAKIDTLWDNYGEKMNPDIQKFYKFYRGMPPYDSVSESLRLLSKILYKFHKKQVIVLVDEHDTPTMHLYSKISLDNPEGNAEIITSIHHYAETVANLLKNSCKSNVFRHQFLMCGVSNSVIDAPYSAFNNLVVHDVLDSRYANFFSLSKQEVEETVNFLFGEIRPELRNKIISNVDEWYNGYYGNDTSPMYSLFSTGQYLNDCFYECITRKIHPQETSEAWIPEPQRYWTKSAITNIFNDYLSIGFQGRLTRFLLSLIRNNQAEFEERDEHFPPMLEDPARSNHGDKIIFHLLLHVGYFEVDKRKDRCFKIPNKELLGVFEEQLDDYLKNILVSDELISDLSRALLDQNYTKLGDEIMKSLHTHSLKDDFNKDDDAAFNERYKVGFKNMSKEKRNFYPQELHIHNILWKAFEIINEENSCSIDQESGRKGVFSAFGKYVNGSYPYFKFPSICAKNGVNFIFELKTEQHDSKGMLYNSLFGLKQIFDQNYHKPILPFKSTESIVSIGIAANATHLNMAVLEIKTATGKYAKADKLLCMEFKVTKGDNSTIRVDHSSVKEAYIRINEK